jgi:hypothetical protein
VVTNLSAPFTGFLTDGLLLSNPYLLLRHILYVLLGLKLNFYSPKSNQPTIVPSPDIVPNPYTISGFQLVSEEKSQLTNLYTHCI